MEIHSKASIFVVAVIAVSFPILVTSYYSNFICFGTGDCILNTGHQEGGMRDASHKWNVECHDGEAIIGVEDVDDNFETIRDVWCKFSFPHKKPSGGYYPYYPHCHVRNFTEEQYTCFDPENPEETIHTFMSGLWTHTFASDDFIPETMKCCRTPPGYYIEYEKCYYKFTHDKYGEHYDGYWLVKCDTNFIATGLGQSINPWDVGLHFVWLQCCPYFYAPPSAHNAFLGNHETKEQYPSQVGYGSQGLYGRSNEGLPQSMDPSLLERYNSKQYQRTRN